MKMKNIPELLAPAGNPERLRTAFSYGADAAYLGMQRMSLRNFADNFSLDDLHAACTYAHALKRRIYVTVNAFARDAQLNTLAPLLRDISDAGADALIINDPGVLVVAREAVPDMELHLSTQANTLNARAASFWHEQGVRRIILARELSFAEIAYINENTPETLELEVFAHGAMCVSYSGRCLLSNYMNGRDSNMGECAQPCRWTYEIRETGTDGAHFPVEQDRLGTYILNARDMNLMEHLPALCATGVKSLKIEGRMKSIYYVAGVVNAYRMALDALANGTFEQMMPVLKQELEKVSHRPYTAGFAFGDPGAAGQEPQSAAYIGTHTLCAVVLEYDKAAHTVLLQQRNRIFEGDVLEVLSPGDVSGRVSVKNLRTEQGERIHSAPHPKERILIDCDVPLKPGDLLRKAITP